MTARLRLLLVAVLAAAAALPALLGAGAATSAVVATRSVVSGSPTPTTGPASRPAGRAAAGAREHGDAVTARRGQRLVAGQGEDATLGSAPLAGAAAAAVGSFALVLGWWVRRSVPVRVPAGRTSGSRRGRAPPALARA